VTHLTAEIPWVNPQMLALARLSRGFTQAELAQATGLHQGTLSKFESGIISPSDADRAKLSEALAYPESFFFEPETVDGPGLTELYHARKRKMVTAGLLSRAYAIAGIRRIHVTKLLKSVEWLDHSKFPVFAREDFDDPEKVARTVRAQLELPTGPIHSMTDLVESAGGIIIGCDFESRYIDGFTKWRVPRLPPLFFINRAQPPDRWRWTLAHELGHAVMHAMQEPSEEMEQEADAFAQELLLPRQYVRNEFFHLTFSRLVGLKTYWKVSIQALIMRAFSIGAITQRQRKYLFMQLSRAGYRLREPSELDPPVEPPQTLTRIVNHHLKELGYTPAEMAQMLNLLEDEFRSTYVSESAPLRVIK
jgi:Zn-dependent peptidase ImmA (M78 family)/transcriptional regulator with XRE-family HTH domain